MPGSRADTLLRITDVIRMNRDAMTPAITDTTAAQVAVDQRRVSAAVSALAPNTRKAYGSAWSAWQRWALDQGRPVLPATAGDVADYLEARHAAGASPATIRLARAAVAKVHQVSGAADPTADGLVTDTLKRIGRDGRDRGRGQVAGIGWSAAEAAASIAANGGDSVAGLRDAALLPGHVRWVAAHQRSVSAAGVRRGSDSRRRGHHHPGQQDRPDGGRRGAVPRRSHGRGRAPLPRCGRHHRRSPVPADPQGRPGHRRPSGGADSIRAIVRKRAAAVDGITGRIGGHSLRVGSARELAADGASLVELQQAGGWRSPTTPAVYVRRESATRGPVARRRYGVRPQ